MTTSRATDATVIATVGVTAIGIAVVVASAPVIFICTLGGIALTALGYSIARAIRRANRVIAGAQFVQSTHVRTIPRQKENAR